MLPPSLIRGLALLSSLGLGACSADRGEDDSSTRGAVSSNDQSSNSTSEPSPPPPPKHGPHRPQLHECIALAINGEAIDFGLGHSDRETLIDLFETTRPEGAPRPEDLAKLLVDQRVELATACISALANLEAVSVTALNDEGIGLESARIIATGPHGVARTCRTDRNGVCQLLLPAILTYNDHLTHSVFNIRAVYEDPNMTLLTSEFLAFEVSDLIDEEPPVIHLTTRSQLCSVSILDGKTGDVLFDVDRLTAVFEEDRLQLPGIEGQGLNKGKWVFSCPKGDPGTVYYEVVRGDRYLELGPRPFRTTATLKWDEGHAKSCQSDWCYGTGIVGGFIWHKRKLPHGRLPPCWSNKELQRRVQRLIDQSTVVIPSEVDCSSFKVTVLNNAIVEPEWLEQPMFIHKKSHSCTGSFSCSR